MDFLSLLGFGKKKPLAEEKPNDMLLLWDDDYLMIELLPAENLGFVIKETARISGFAANNTDGLGYTDITLVGDSAIKTRDRSIPLADVERIMCTAGLEKVSEYYHADAGILRGTKAPLGFGTNTFAIICEKEGAWLSHIWLTGKTNDEHQRQKLVTALLAFGGAYKFIAVNWYQCTYYNLSEQGSVEDFVHGSC